MAYELGGYEVMVEGPDARSQAKQLALTARRILFRQNRQLQEESHARYSQELAGAFDRLVSELNDLLTGLCRIKVELNGLEVFQEKDNESVLIGSICTSYLAPRHFSFQVRHARRVTSSVKTGGGTHIVLFVGHTLR
jgi:hypothetical protein